MADRLEWVDADAAVNVLEWTTTPSEWGDYVEDDHGPSGAIRFGGVAIQGEVPELRDLVSRLEEAINEIEQALEEVGGQ